VAKSLVAVTSAELFVLVDIDKDSLGAFEQALKDDQRIEADVYSERALNSMCSSGCRAAEILQFGDHVLIEQVQHFDDAAENRVLAGKEDFRVDPSVDVGP